MVTTTPLGRGRGGNEGEKLSVAVSMYSSFPRAKNIALLFHSGTSEYIN